MYIKNKVSANTDQFSEATLKTDQNIKPPLHHILNGKVSRNRTVILDLSWRFYIAQLRIW